MKKKFKKKKGKATVKINVNKNREMRRSKEYYEEGNISFK